MSLVNLVNVDYSVGGPLLLEKVDLAIERNERVCIVGRNGAGKSTLLKLIAGEIRPDDGEVRTEGGVSIARLTQEVPNDLEGTIFDVVAGALGHLGQWLAEFHRLTHHLDEPGAAEAMTAVQARIDAGNGWNLDQRVGNVLARLQLDEEAQFSDLSGGMKRRVLLGRALVLDPDVLLLDEPTNHLDIEAIAWLEQLLLDFGGSVLFVTHDRRFLRALATRIVEIDRGQVTSWPGDYENYLRRREERLHAEAQAHALFDKKLAQEEVWIRQGIKARRTRTKAACARSRRCGANGRSVANWGGNAKLQVGAAGSSGRRVIDVDAIRFAFGERLIVDGLTTTIQRGDRIGLIGANGSGKTTLLKLLLANWRRRRRSAPRHESRNRLFRSAPHASARGSQRARQRVGRRRIHSDQRRAQARARLPAGFPVLAGRARAPITALSGGERNRLLLAKLFAKPSNLLVMDEPTNDLDVETLELLEELLAAYQARCCWSRMIASSSTTSSPARSRSKATAASANTSAAIPIGSASRHRSRPRARPSARRSSRSAETSAAVIAKRKLTYKDARELELLPQRIETLEARIADIGTAMQEPSFYQQDGAAITATNDELAKAQRELDAAYARWQELDAG